MRYSKDPLSVKKQVDLLISRGMSTDDRDAMAQKLSTVNYYRLTGYAFPFREMGGEKFQKGCSFETIWLHYIFDRELRLLVLDAIERIEIAIRTMFAQHHSQKYGAFGYYEASSLPNINKKFRNTHGELKEKLVKEVNRSTEIFVKHYLEKYDEEGPILPIWMAVELMSFGMVCRFIGGSNNDIKRAISAPFELHFKVIESWLLSLNAVRNICAHHQRLWNRNFSVKPAIPDSVNWKEPILIDNPKIFGILMICKYMLSVIAPESRWGQRLKNLLKKHDGILIEKMGFPENWETSPIWNRRGIS